VGGEQVSVCSRIEIFTEKGSILVIELPD
jgi:hypothetical protein